MLYNHVSATIDLGIKHYNSNIMFRSDLDLLIYFHQMALKIDNTKGWKVTLFHFFQDVSNESYTCSSLSDKQNG